MYLDAYFVFKWGKLAHISYLVYANCIRWTLTPDAENHDVSFIKGYKSNIIPSSGLDNKLVYSCMHTIIAKYGPCHKYPSGFYGDLVDIISAASGWDLKDFSCNI